MNHHKHFLDEKWGRIISPRSESEPASKPAGSRAPGWTPRQCLKTASNRTCWKSSSILVWKSNFFSSLKPKWHLSTQVPNCAQWSVYSGDLVSEDGALFLFPHPSAHSILFPDIATPYCWQTASELTFNPHIPTESELCTAPQHSLDNIPHVPATSKMVERGEAMECMESCRSTVKSEDITGQATFK